MLCNEMMNERLKQLPGVDKLLAKDEIKTLLSERSSELVKYAIRVTLEEFRQNLIHHSESYEEAKLLELIKNKIYEIETCSLKQVINGTGVLLHTNLGRAPLGEQMLKDLAPVILGYSNLEQDLETGKRGNRNQHFKHLITYLTKSEDAVVVNNNAAAVFLCLNTFGKNCETIVSRGELIEIGGSFRLPDIMKSSGTKMIEVGTTNKTRLSDYENAITENTRIIIKAHRSNFFMEGFTEEVDLKELAVLARKYNLILIYDLGSGLLRKPKCLDLFDEPDIVSAIQAGVDVVTFSGDKLLGGPQAGIIIGKKNFIRQLASAPLMRILRVGKLTTAALLSAMSQYLNDESLIKNVPVFRFLNRTPQELHELAKKLASYFSKVNVDCKWIANLAYTGGGTLPKTVIQSYAVEILSKKMDADKLYLSLLKLPLPIVTILREGRILIDVFTLEEKDFEKIASAVSKFINV
jgi:L-seryl-tRNA(Ser) seleniumtransferase